MSETRPPALPFESERLAMRALSVDDAPALHEAYRDADAMRYWSSAPHADVAETIAYLTPRADHEAWRGWTITRKGEDRAIGTLATHQRRPGVAEIGYMIVPSAAGQGYAREGVKRLLDLLIREEGHHRVFADVDPENARSVRLLEALGFRREGVLRQEWRTHIGLRDSAIYGVLADEWSRAD